MKIAVCLSGKPRFLEKGYYQIFENIISRNDNVDFFIHTWWDKNNSEEFVKGYSGDKLDDFGRVRICQYSSDTLEKIVRYYNPKSMITEPQIYFDTPEDVNYESVNPQSLYSMLYSIKISNDLKEKYEMEKGFEYDVVIRSRFDVIFDKLDINLSSIDPSRVYTDEVGIGFSNDQFAISSSAGMNYYSRLFDMLDIYYKNGFKGFVGERLMTHHLGDRLYLSENIKNNIIKND